MQATAPVSAIRSGSCPHGLPPGACPICSGGGAGGMRKADSTAKAGEMSWSQCAAIGAFLKAQQESRAQRADDFRQQAQVSFQANLQNTAAKTVALAQIITQNFPPIIAKPVNFVLNTFGKILEVPQKFANLTQQFSAKLVDISDKLVAMQGELKAALKEKTEKFLAKFKKTLKSIVAKEADERNTDN